jgi:hypothetical protein
MPDSGAFAMALDNMVRMMATSRVGDITAIAAPPSAIGLRLHRLLATEAIPVGRQIIEFGHPVLHIGKNDHHPV